MALSGVWSPPVTGAAGQWLPGLSKGEEEKREGVDWARQDTLRGRRKLAGRRKSSGRGRRLQGPGEPQWRNRAQRRLRKRLSPAEGSRRQNSAQVTSPLSVLCTPPRSAAIQRAQEFGTQCFQSFAYCSEGNQRKRRDYFFRLITFPSLLLFPPSPFFFFFFFLHFATSCD